MKKIFLVSAEQSAELYASKIVDELRKKIDISVTGIGGDKLKNSGAELLLRSEDVSVVGVMEVFSHFFKIREGLKKCVNWIKQNMPEMVILFDFPDFNFWLIKKIRKFYKGKIVYIISPQVWAWRKNRKYFLKKYLDKMIVILPFEKKIYDEIGFSVEYLGHPLVDIVVPNKTITEFKDELGVKHKNKLITVLPGSRKKEILHHSDILKKSIESLKKKYSDIEFVIVSANTSCYEIIKNVFSKNSRIHIINGDAYNAINASHIVIAKSGTVTLETALLEKPAVVFYKVNTLSYIIAKMFVDVKYVALPNLLLNKKVYPEYLQNDFNVENITASVERFLEDADLYVETVEQLQDLKKQLGEKGFFKRAANKIEEWLYE
jgi:lipid-A-disaccharide synthase